MELEEVYSVMFWKQNKNIYDMIVAIKQIIKSKIDFKSIKMK